MRRTLYEFQCKQLAAAYEAHRSRTDPHDTGDELALVRLCLSAIVAKVKATDLASMDSSAISALTLVAREVSSLAESFTRVERQYKGSVQLSELYQLLDGVAGIFAKYLPPDQASKAVQELFALPIPMPPDEFERPAVRRTASPLLVLSSHEDDADMEATQ